MDDLAQTDTALNGFVDYSAYFEPTEGIWLAVGIVIWLGTFVSVIPQILLLIQRRTAYGLSWFTVMLNNFTQFLMVIHYWHLHTTEFVGLFQMEPKIGLPRLLTFCNFFCLWLGFLAVPFCMLVFNDREIRPKANSDQIRHQWIGTIISLIVLIAVCFAQFIAYVCIGTGVGFSSSSEVTVGGVYGTVSGFLVMAQYIPQMITTIKLKDKGSLSVLMLAIQAPGGYISAMFMKFGQNEHWTTWISYLVAATDQAILLFICLYFMWKKRKGTDESSLELSNQQKNISHQLLMDGNPDTEDAK